MNWTIYGMECVGALILFTCLIMISLCKNPVWWMGMLVGLLVGMCVKKL